MPAPTLRSAEEADAAALVRLQREIYREGRWFVGDGPPTTDSLARRLRSLDAEQSLVLVAEGRPGLAGWLELHRLPPRRMRHIAVLTIAVAAPWRRHGVGRRLMRAGYCWARDAGIRKISLNVRSGNAAALALYEREGFVVEGRERDQVRTDDGFEDNVIMAKFL